MGEASDNLELPRGDRIACAGFSLVELLIVISLLGIFAGVILTRFDPSLQDQLRAAAQIVAADIDYARNLAVTNDSNYRLTFEVANNRYRLEHSGGTAALNVLPDSAFRHASDSPTQHTTDLSALPIGSRSVELAGVEILTPALTAVTTLEFGPLGETTRPEPTVIWLAAGVGDARRYLAIQVDPVTGQASIGRLQPNRPGPTPTSPPPGPSPTDPLVASETA